MNKPTVALTRMAFEALLDRYGPDMALWPDADRAAALVLIESSASARAVLAAAQDVERVLRARPGPGADASLRARILDAAPPHAAPPHAAPNWAIERMAPTRGGITASGDRWAGRLWRWLPVGSSVAAMTASLLLGFLVGFQDPAIATQSGLDVDLLALAFGPDIVDGGPL